MDGTLGGGSMAWVVSFGGEVMASENFWVLGKNRSLTKQK